MTQDIDDGPSPLEAFLSGPALDYESHGEPPLRDGDDPLLTRDRVDLESPGE